MNVLLLLLLKKSNHMRASLNIIKIKIEMTLIVVNRVKICDVSLEVHHAVIIVPEPSQ